MNWKASPTVAVNDPVFFSVNSERSGEKIYNRDNGHKAMSL